MEGPLSYDVVVVVVVVVVVEDDVGCFSCGTLSSSLSSSAGQFQRGVRPKSMEIGSVEKYFGCQPIQI